MPCNAWSAVTNTLRLWVAASSVTTTSWVELGLAVKFEPAAPKMPFFAKTRRLTGRLGALLATTVR